MVDQTAEDAGSGIVRGEVVTKGDAICAKGKMRVRPTAGRGKVGVLQVVEPVLLIEGFKERLAAQELIELRHCRRGTGDLVFNAHIQAGGLTGDGGA